MYKAIFKYSAFLFVAVCAGYAGGQLSTTKNTSDLLNSSSIAHEGHLQQVSNSYSNLVDHPLNFVSASEKSTPAVVYIKTTANVP